MRFLYATERQHTENTSIAGKGSRYTVRLHVRSFCFFAKFGAAGWAIFSVIYWSDCVSACVIYLSVCLYVCPRSVYCKSRDSQTCFINLTSTPAAWWRWRWRCKVEAIFEDVFHRTKRIPRMPPDNSHYVENYGVRPTGYSLSVRPFFATKAIAAYLLAR